MKISARRSVMTLAIASALVLAPMLTGCGAVEGIIEQATGGDVDVSMGSLPEGWPAEVPVADGDIIVGGKTTDEGGAPVYNATIKIASESVFDDIEAQLVGAGFEKVEAGDVDGGDSITTGFFKNATYGVVVAVTGTEGQFVANYTVVEGDPTGK